MPKRSSRFVVPFFPLLVALALWLPASAGAEPEAGAAGWMYDPGQVTAIDLTLAPAERAKLEADPQTYVKGEFSLAKVAGSVPGGEETPVVSGLPVEVRLEGSLGGSFRDLSGKAAFKLEFKKAEPFLGLRKMTLDNMVEDRSLIHETLAYRVFRAAGVAAPRTGFAFVRLDGRDYGIYLNLENLDRVNLERWLGPFAEPQHLYEGEGGTDVTAGSAADFEVDEGSESDRGDLEALIAAADGSEGQGWSQQAEAVADLTQMTRMWAVEKYIGHWDSYSGRPDPSNYYLYSDGAGRFQMLPWGTDLTWERRIPFDGPGGLLFQRCLADPACATLYRQQLQAVAGVVAGLDLTGFGKETAALLEPWERVDPRLEHPEDVAAAVAATLDFVAARPRELASWLVGGEAGEPQEGGSTEAGRSAGQVHVLGASRFHGLRVGASAVVNGVLATHIHVAAAGTATQHVQIAAGDGTASACATREPVARAGAFTLHCVLAPSARRRLRRRWLRLVVETRFVTADRLRVEATRSLVARRDAGL